MAYSIRQKEDALDAMARGESALSVSKRMGITRQTLGLWKAERVKGAKQMDGVALVPRPTATAGKQLDAWELVESATPEAIQAVIDVLRDPDATPPARLRAAELILSRAGMTARTGESRQRAIVATEDELDWNLLTDEEFDQLEPVIKRIRKTKANGVAA